MNHLPRVFAGLILTFLFTQTVAAQGPVQFDVGYPKIVSDVDHWQLLVKGSAWGAGTGLLDKWEITKVSGFYIEEGVNIQKGIKATREIGGRGVQKHIAFSSETNIGNPPGGTRYLVYIVVEYRQRRTNGKGPGETELLEKHRIVKVP